MNPFANNTQQLKSELQAAINSLGTQFFNECSFEPEGYGAVVTWSGFGHESSSWYHVALYSQVETSTIGGEKKWVCIGSAVIDATTLKWDKVNKAEVPL